MIVSTRIVPNPLLFKTESCYYQKVIFWLKCLQELPPISLTESYYYPKYKWLCLDEYFPLRINNNYNLFFTGQKILFVYNLDGGLVSQKEVLSSKQSKKKNWKPLISPLPRIIILNAWYMIICCILMRTWLIYCFCRFFWFRIFEVFWIIPFYYFLLSSISYQNN